MRKRYLSISAASSSRFVTTSLSCAAFLEVMTGTPVCISMAFARRQPPCLRHGHIYVLRKGCRCLLLEISVVVASASIFSTSSSVVMLSRRFSFSSLLGFCTAGWTSPTMHGRDLIGEDGVFHALLHAAGIPFIGQFFANLDGLQPLVNPLAGIALLR